MSIEVGKPQEDLHILETLWNQSLFNDVYSLWVHCYVVDRNYEL